MTGGGGLARIDVADDDHVDVHLFLTHLDGIEFLSVCVWFCVFFGKKVELQKVIA